MTSCLLLLFLATQTHVVLAKLPESAQIPGDGSAKICCITKNLTSQRNELIQQKYAMSSIWLRLWLVVTWLRIRVRVTNMLRQQKKWADSAKMRCVSKNLLSYQNAWWWLNKDSWVSKNLLSQQKSTDSRRDLSRSTTTYFCTTSSNVYCVWTLGASGFCRQRQRRVLWPSCLHHRFNAVLNSWVHI